jgi:hypothetical protein
MADKPYQERKGGSYVRDKETGKLIPAAEFAAKSTTAVSEPVEPKAGEQPRKGK